MSNNNALREKLNFLLFQKGMRAMDLARQINVPQPTLHRILNGKSKKPHQETLIKIANYFNLSLSELTNTPLSENEQSAAIQPLPSITHSIPQIIIEHEATLDDMKQLAKKHLLVNDDISAQAFCISLNDESLLPVFTSGSTLIFDPLKKPKIRNYVLVMLGGINKYTIRQLLSDGEHYFLKPLNPEIANLSIKVLEEQDKIIAPLVEARQSYL